MSVLRIFILIAFVDAVRSERVWNYFTLEPDKNGAFRELQSPNYGNEHGMRTFNSWTINLPSTKDYMTIYVDDLRLHYMDKQNKTRCMPSYDFRINGEKFGCKPDEFVSKGINEFCIQFRKPTCAQRNSCKKNTQIVDKVHITFTTAGKQVQQGQTPIVHGFRIHYAIFDCSGLGTSIPSDRRTVTPITLSTSTQRPLQPVPVSRNSVDGPQSTQSTSRSTTALLTQISATTTTTTTVKGETSPLEVIPTTSKSSGISSAKADSSNQNKIAVASASNVTRRFQLTSTTPPTANKSRGEDDFDQKVTFTIDIHWIILASALGGGLLLIVVVAICCKIQRNKKSKREGEETGTEDSSSNQDKTELPAYSTVEDVSSNQKSSQQEETTNQNASQTDSNLEEKLVVENVAYEASQESPTTSVTQPKSTLAESIQNDEDKPAIIDEAGDEFYSVVRLKSNKDKTTVRYLKENIVYDDAP